MGIYTNLLHLTPPPKLSEPELNHQDLPKDTQLQNSPSADPNRTVASAERNQQPNNRTVSQSERLHQPNDRTVASTERSGARRSTIRYSFEFYVDQIEAIRRVRAQRELEGKKVGLSDIVRESMDQFLQNTDPK